MGILSSNYGIGAAALAVQSYLGAHDGLEVSYDLGRYQADVNQAPWYNGRERGIVFYMRDRKWTSQINVVVFEHRNSDSICVLRWEGNTFNPPSLSDIPEGTYKDKWDTTKDFSHGDAVNCAQWIYDELTAFWLKHQGAANAVTV